MSKSSTKQKLYTLKGWLQFMKRGRIDKSKNKNKYKKKRRNSIYK